jgi:hypothetical protein
MSAIQIGDQAMCKGADGILFQGTVMDIRPRCRVCGNWHNTGEQERAHDFAGGMASEPFLPGRLVFIATPGWPHMHCVLDEYRAKRKGVWRAGEEHQ